MIEFHLDARSGVAPYLQLVQQVRHALRLGLLREGDQLPTVKDVVAAWRSTRTRCSRPTGSSNTRGWRRPGRGSGTFVTGTLNDGSLAAHGPLRHDLAALAGQGPPGRAGRREHRGALPGHAFGPPPRRT